MKMFVIGIFECGCEYEANLSSIEIIECQTMPQVEEVMKRMQKYSLESQCHPKGAEEIIIAPDGLLCKIGSKDTHRYSYDDNYKKALEERKKDMMEDLEFYKKELIGKSSAYDFYNYWIAEIEEALKDEHERASEPSESSANGKKEENDE